MFSLLLSLCKKNRPAYRLTVVCNEEKMGLLQKVIFTQTTTIGIRYRKEQRTVLKRQIKEIETPLGKLQVKEVEIDGEKDVIQNMKVLKN